MHKLLFFILLIIVAGSMQAQPQTETKELKAIDSLHNSTAVDYLEQWLAGDKQGSLYNKVLVFSNPDCHHCDDVKKVLNESHIVFVEFDLRDMRLVGLLHNMVVRKEKSDKVAYGFPIVLYRDDMWYSIRDLTVFRQELMTRLGGN